MRGFRTHVAVLVALPLSLLTVQPGWTQPEGGFESALMLLDLEVDKADLNWILSEPYAARSAPVRITLQNLSYSGEIRLRGNTSRALPKPSWRIELPDHENPFGQRVLLLRAEYRDASMMRNHAAHRLFRRFGFRAPETTFVRVRMNGEDAGVYLQVERVDALFLEKRGLARGDLFSMELNAGRWYPYLDHANVPIGWNARIQTADAHKRVEEVLMRLAFTSYEEFPEVVDQYFEADHVLRYYAIVYAIMGRDAMIDNYFVYANPSTGKFEFIPWDLDATLGNAYDGSYDERLETSREWGYIHSNLLQRMLEYEHWQERFAFYLAIVANDGLDFLAEEIERTADWIAEEVANDPARDPEHIAFDTAVEQLRFFLERRRETLLDHPAIIRQPVYEIRTSRSIPPPDEPSVDIHVHSVPERSLYLWFAYEIRRYEWSATRRDRVVLLHDDGEAPDSIAGDGWYAARVDLSEQMGDLVTMGVITHDQQIYAPSPSIFNAHHITAATYAFNLRSGGEETYAVFEFEPVLRVGGEVHVPLVNRSGVELDMSGFFVQAGPPFQRVVVPWGTEIPADGRLVVTSSASSAVRRFPEATVVGGVAADVAAGDTLSLLSPMQAPLVTARAEVRSDALPRVLINEINYRSATEADAGDWVELMNLDSSYVSLANWQLLDGDDDHVFRLPTGAAIPAGGFVVLAANTHRFHSQHEVSVPVYGNFSFGFDGAGEMVRLRNGDGELVSKVEYGDSRPWPGGPDGSGTTLELVSPELDPAHPESWAASLSPGGTPGRPNSVTSSPDPELPSTSIVIGMYPNPVQDVLRVVYDLAAPSDVKVAVYDLLGRRLLETNSWRQAGRSQRSAVDLSNFASGTYVVSLEVNGVRLAARPIIHVR